MGAPTQIGRQAAGFTVAISEGHDRRTFTEASFAAAASRALEEAADAQEAGRFLVAVVYDRRAVPWFRCSSSGELWALDHEDLATVHATLGS